MNQSLNRWEQTILVHLIEECAEVQKIATKILRFGLYNTNPKTGKLNIGELNAEILDLSACIKILENQNIISLWDHELDKSIERRLKATDKEIEDAFSNVQSSEDSTPT